MSNTACINIYSLNADYNITVIRNEIAKKNYTKFLFKDEIQTANDITIEAYSKYNLEIPDWAKLINTYLLDQNQFNDAKKYSSIILIFINNDSQNRCFIISGGNGASCIQKYFDYHFGINILERVFDKDVNKLDSVREKGIIGDVLASSRYYRRSRSLAYEDDFGKYFQDLDLKLEKDQIEECFPAIKNYKGNQLKAKISISCSASIEIKMKIDFITVIRTIKDIMVLQAIDAPRIFNTSLVPLTIRRNKTEIILNYIFLRKKLIDAMIMNSVINLDLDICHLEFEKYYQSTSFKIISPELHRNSKKQPVISQITRDNMDDLSDASFLGEIYQDCISSVEYENSMNKILFLKEYLQKVRIETYNSDGDLLTEGNIIDYLQTEIDRDHIYFLIDKTWYRLQSEFDKSLNDKYLVRIGKNIRTYSFIKNWNNKDETAYNELYNSKKNPIYLHLMKVDYIELCDVIHVDHDNKKIYIIHVKIGLGASIRDLVSQALISARIIEQEVLSDSKERLSALYDHAVGKDRINNSELSKSDFLNYFNYDREYCLAFYDNGVSDVSFKTGDISSRIAKFSLVEFSSVMNMSGWKYSIVKIV